MEDLEWAMIRHQQHPLAIVTASVCKRVFFFKQPTMITKSDTNI